MVLTNLGAAVGNKLRIKESWRVGIAQREGKKISKSVEMWFNAIGPTTSYDGVVIISFRSS